MQEHRKPRASLDPKQVGRLEMGVSDPRDLEEREARTRPLTLRSALEMTRSARAVEARTPTRTARRRKAVRRRGGNDVAIFPRPDRVGFAARCGRRRFKPSLARAEEAARLDGQPVWRSGWFLLTLFFYACDLDLFQNFHEL
jgi:hypothetical protein